MSDYTLQQLQLAAEIAVKTGSYGEAERQSGIKRQTIRSYCIKNKMTVVLKRKVKKVVKEE